MFVSERSTNTHAKAKQMTILVNGEVYEVTRNISKNIVEGYDELGNEAILWFNEKEGDWVYICPAPEKK